MNRMLINATQQEELRVALISGQILLDLDIEHAAREQKKANIYKGRITRIEPSLEAVFVDYGADRHGFLPFKEIAPEYLKPENRHQDRPNYRDNLKVNQEIMIQVEKEERGNKGAALTTYVSLAGCYLVLMPNNPGAGGISRRIEGDDRADMREIISSLNIPEGMGLIVRTAGVGRSQEELQWDLGVLFKLWEAIKIAFNERPAPFLIHQESDVVMRAVRDYLRKDINEILIDNPDVFTRAQQQIALIRPDFSNRLKLYKDTVPLFSRFQIENQIESAFQRVVHLPAGSSIVIDHTEALVSIDINSGKATKGVDIEETALNTNLEAADEIARQLRLRDLGGLIVIDFIDMSSNRNQRLVEERLREALKLDRARVQIGRISRFGLLEMSRQRLRASLGESSLITCPRCTGQGNLRSIESLALSIMRIMEEDALKEKTARVQAQLPVDVATYLLNEKRQALMQIEQRHKVQILLVPNPHLETPHYKITRIRHDEIGTQGEGAPSYEMVEQKFDEITLPSAGGHTTEAPAVRNIVETAPAAKPKAGIFGRLLASLFHPSKKEAEAPVATTEKSPRTRGRDDTSNRDQAGRHSQKRPPRDREREQRTGERGEQRNAAEREQRSGSERGEQRDGRRGGPPGQKRQRGHNNRNRRGGTRYQSDTSPTQTATAQSEMHTEVPEREKPIAAAPVERPKAQEHHQPQERRPEPRKQPAQQEMPLVQETAKPVVDEVARVAKTAIKPTPKPEMVAAVSEPVIVEPPKEKEPAPTVGLSERTTLMTRGARPSTRRFGGSSQTRKRSGYVPPASELEGTLDVTNEVSAAENVHVDTTTLPTENSTGQTDKAE